MKRKLPLIVTAVVSSLAVVLVVVLSVLPARASAPAEAKDRIVSVDYVLALMDAGIDQKEIVRRVEEKNLAFRLAPGDIDRLREAGAGKNLIEVVTAEGVVLENHEGAPSGAAARPQEQGGTDTSQWGHPSRLGREESGRSEGNGPRPEASPAPSASSTTGEEAEDSDEGIEEEPYGGYGAYPDYYYSPGYYSFIYSYGNPYPYYYYPSYYYPYRSSYFSTPYYSYPRNSYRTVPRGGGSVRSVPRGGGGGVRSTPRGGGSPRSAPRGSHHH